MDKKMIHMITFTLMFIGALNWGLIGLLDFNLVGAILGSMPALEKIVYILVGVSAVYVMATHMSDCKICSKK